MVRADISREPVDSATVADTSMLLEPIELETQTEIPVELRFPHLLQCIPAQNTAASREESAQELRQIAGGGIEAAGGRHSQRKYGRRKDTAIVGPKERLCGGHGLKGALRHPKGIKYGTLEVAGERLLLRSLQHVPG
jgi:hypothetical protein